VPYAPRAFSSRRKALAALQRKRPLLLQLEAFVVLSRPLRRGPPGVQKELNRAAAAIERKWLGRGAASWPIGTPVLCTRNQLRRGLAGHMAMVGVVCWQQPQADKCCPRAGRQQSIKTCAVFTRPCW